VDGIAESIDHFDRRGVAMGVVERREPAEIEEHDCARFAR